MKRGLSETIYSCEQTITNNNVVRFHSLSMVAMIHSINFSSVLERFIRCILFVEIGNRTSCVKRHMFSTIQ